MILIIGGAYQGKLDYALTRFSLSENDVYRCNAEKTDMPKGKKIIYETDKWILALIKNETETEPEIKKFMDSNNGAIVICNDISCGVVPIDPVMRKWRDAAGRSLAALSQKSDEVIRLFCGIPSRLK